MKKTALLIGLTATILSLAACGAGTKERLGLGRNSPDEFTVLERAPLTVPPNFNLVPPTPGAARPQEQTPKQTAQNLVLRAVSSAPTAAAAAKPGVTSGQNALLQQAGAPQADANIRAKLATEVGVGDAGKPESVIEKIGIKTPAEKGNVINPITEKQALEAKKIKTPAVVIKSNNAQKP
jgi:hypothetical protein